MSKKLSPAEELIYAYTTKTFLYTFAQKNELDHEKLINDSDYFNEYAARYYTFLLEKYPANERKSIDEQVKLKREELKQFIELTKQDFNVPLNELTTSSSFLSQEDLDDLYKKNPDDRWYNQ
jgi:tRNA isopentenyl-2-thiomethyl-A-37 hydroxylase MiaE